MSGHLKRGWLSAGALPHGENLPPPHPCTVSVPFVTPRDLRPDPCFPSYWLLGRLTSMSSALWRESRVTVRDEEEDTGLLARELHTLSGLAHPNLLLLMAFSQSLGGSLQLVYEHVQFGSLFICLHERPLPALTKLVAKVDVMLQVTDALIFLHSRGLVHCLISSHAVQLVSGRLAKLGQLEGCVRAGSQGSTACSALLPWAAPELWRRGRCSPATDVYSLSCLLWEVTTGALPWQVTEAREELPLDRRLPRYVRRLLRHGLVRRPEERDLELAEVRDMLLLTRRMEEEAKLERQVVEGPPVRVQHLSRSAIQADVAR